MRVPTGSPATLRFVDPNWFYSTLAQSTAAIVGLVGAFLIQRVLAIREEIAEDRVALRQKAMDLMADFASTRRTLRGVMDEFPAIQKQIADGVAAGAERIKVEGSLTALRPGAEPWGRATALDGSGQPKNMQGLDARTVEVEGARQALEELRESLPGNLTDLAGLLRTRGRSHEPVEVSDQEREAVRTVAVTQTGWGLVQVEPITVKQAYNYFAGRSEPIGQGVKALRDRVALRSFVTLLAILAFLMAAGVVAPMFFLSDQADVPRSALLGPFILGAFALLAYYAYELYRLNTVADLSREHL